MANSINGFIHPTAIIGDDVDIAQDVTIGPYAVVLGPVTIGRGSSIGAGVLLGGPPEIASLPQRRGWMGEGGYHGVRIGADVVIRERAVIHQGSVRETVIGDRTWILNSVYLAHDVEVGADATISAGVTVGGHASIGEWANIGMNAAVHQRRVVGPGAMIGMSTPLTRDAPPFAMVYGNPPRLRGVNRVAIARAGLPEDAAHVISAAYTSGPEAVQRIQTESPIPRLQEIFAWWDARAQRRLAHETARMAQG